jgi:hypothetical protein
MRVDVNIDIDDIYYELSDREKQELVDLLEDDGLVLPIDESLKSPGGLNHLDHEWIEALDKINKARYILTKEQEDMIINLASKL